VRCGSGDCGYFRVGNVSNDVGYSVWFVRGNAAGEQRRACAWDSVNSWRSDVPSERPRQTRVDSTILLA
jgi:hypothetical protein